MAALPALYRTDPRVLTHGDVSRVPAIITANDFAHAIGVAPPFETCPHVAVGVSGGADSMALLLLADRWARTRRGRVTALTVDHGLRPESGAEARQVARWCRTLGIAHKTLSWHPASGIAPGDVQAAARAARYQLMEDWCGTHAVLHLLTAHNLEDQGETFLMRLGRQSGLAGLAAMAGVRETGDVRLIRPLLGFSRQSLEAFLIARGQAWIDDPSNRNPAYARVRLRSLGPVMTEEGLGVDDRARLAARFGDARRGIEDGVAALLARSAAPHPAGFILLDRVGLAVGGADLGMPALANVLRAVAGRTYPARNARLRALYDALCGSIPGRFRGRTLAGCRIVPHDAETVLVCREAGAIAPAVPVGPGAVLWDGRFRLRLTGCGTAMLVALGEAGWTALRKAAQNLAESPAAQAIPALVRGTLPALWDVHGLLEAPHLGYRRFNEPAATLSIVDAWPDVLEPLNGPRFGTPENRARKLVKGPPHHYLV